MLLTVCGADHYSTLGLRKSASAADIRKAYRAEALKCHPDRVLDSKPHERSKAEERFKSVTEAHEVLSDPRRRRVYDLQQRLPPGMRDERTFHASRGFPFPDGFGGAFPAPPEVPLPPVQRAVVCTLEELHDGLTRRVVLADSPLRRLLDAYADRFASRSSRDALVKTSSFTASLLWRFPRLLFGPVWYVRLLALALSYSYALSQQLPPSPTGTYEIQVKPGHRRGTKWRFARGLDGREVAFELRERRHARGLVRRKHDLVFGCAVSRRAALRGTTLSVPVLCGEAHELELRLEPHERDAATVSRCLAGRGMPVRGKASHGDLLVEITLRGAAAQALSAAADAPDQLPDQPEAAKPDG